MNFRCFVFVIVTFCFSGLIYGETLDLNKTIKKIELKGLVHVQGKDVRSRYPTFSVETGARIQENDLDRDLNGLFLTGYFKKITPYTEVSGNGLILYYAVQENPLVNTIIIKGNSEISSQLILDAMKNKPGKVLNIQDLNKDMDIIKGEVVEKGYDLFQFTRVEFSDENDIEMYVNEGVISSITWDGLKTIEQYVLDREIESKPGMVFNSKRLRRDRERLLQLGYFSDISAPILEENFDKTKVNVGFILNERSVNRVDTGFEFDQRDEDLTLFFRGDINHVLQHTDLLSAKVQFSLRNTEFNRNRYSLSYYQPWIFNAVPISFDTNVFLDFRRERTSNRSDTNLYDSGRQGGRITFGFPILRDTLDLYTRLNVEDVRLPGNRPPGVSPYSVQSYEAILAYNTVENRQNPRGGDYWTFRAERGEDLGFFNDPLKFTKLSLDAATFYPVSDKSVFGIHVFTGVFKPDDNIVTFEDEVFDIGGANTLRGYQESEFVGFRTFVLNAEYRYQLTPSLETVLFYDAGKVFNTEFDLSTDTFNTSWGTGIRISTPIGPIRFDLAFSQDNDTFLHFSLGQMF